MEGLQIPMSETVASIQKILGAFHTLFKRAAQLGLCYTFMTY